MTVLVTGAGGAIGAAVVERLLAEGRDVVAHDLRPVEVAEHPGAAPPALRRLTGDVADGVALGAAVGELGVTLDAVIAAHGVDGSAALADVDDAFARRVLAINAASVPTLLEAVRPHLARPAAFVVVGSQAGLVGEADNAAYCASKFAVHAWAAAQARRERDVAIRVLAPGCTETPLLFAAQERFAAAQGVPTQEFVDRRRARIPLERFASVRETAAAAVYLAAAGAPRPPLLAATGGEVLW